MNDKILGFVVRITPYLFVAWTIWFFYLILTAPVYTDKCVNGHLYRTESIYKTYPLFGEDGKPLKCIDK